MIVVYRATPKYGDVSVKEMLIDSIATGDSLSPLENKRLHFVTTWMQSSKIKQ